MLYKNKALPLSAHPI